MVEAGVELLSPVCPASAEAVEEADAAPDPELFAEPEEEAHPTRESNTDDVRNNANNFFFIKLTSYILLPCGIPQLISGFTRKIIKGEILVLNRKFFGLTGRFCQKAYPQILKKIFGFHIVVLLINYVLISYM